MTQPSDLPAESARPDRTPQDAPATRPASEAASRPQDTAPSAKSPAPTSPATAEQPRSERTPAERTPTVPEEVPTAGGGKTAGLWISLILGAIVLVMLLIFVIQNNKSASFVYFATEFQLPLGVAMLLAAIAGALVMALVGSVRMMQMGWTIRKLRKQQEKIQRTLR